MTIIEIKLAEAWAIKTLAEGVVDKTIIQAMESINVPQNLRELVEVNVADRIIEVLPNSN